MTCEVIQKVMKAIVKDEDKDCLSCALYRKDMGVGDMGCLECSRYYVDRWTAKKE
jgi:hypothetical protein